MPRGATNVNALYKHDLFGNSSYPLMPDVELPGEYRFLPAHEAERNWRAFCHDFSTADSLEFEAFEDLVCLILEKANYVAIKPTQRATCPDGNVDVAAFSKGHGLLSFAVCVQVKHRKTRKNVGVEDVTQLGGTLGRRPEFHTAMLVTNRGFTRGAHEAAHELKAGGRYVLLRGRRYLERWSRGLFLTDEDLREMNDIIRLKRGVAIESPKQELIEDYAAQREFAGQAKITRLAFEEGDDGGIEQAG